VKNYQKDKPFVFRNNIKVKGGDFSQEERNSLEQKMYAQLNDSSKVVVNDAFFIFHKIKYAPNYDTSYAAISAKNLRNTLLHMGYYHAKDSFSADTVKGTYYVSKNWLPRFEKNKRVTVNYVVEAGNPTRIDTFSYKIKMY
jgi:hypothetical protein